MQLVRKIAWHVHAHVSSAMEIEDLIQIGMIALVEAANGYEDRGHAFSTYASMRIRGAMIDHLRRHATRMPIRHGPPTRNLATVKKRLESILGREPQEAEMAGREWAWPPRAFRALVDEVEAVTL
jgi:RNA polymerase sigma factor for flagellar operon FliA